MTTEEQRIARAAHTLVQLIVRDTDAAVVVAENINGCLMLQVQVAPEDVGRLIGSRGATARSIRILLDAVAWRLKVHYQLNLPHGGKEQA